MAVQHLLLSNLLLSTSLLLSDALTSPKPIGPIHTLILTRHGDSVWNGKYPGCKETFTGWTDVELSPIGEQEAIRTGQLLTEQTRGMNIDALFTSTLTRARMTAHHCWWAYNNNLDDQYMLRSSDTNGNSESYQYQAAPAQFIIDHRLNERHYGSLQGLIKADAEAGKHGHDPDDVYQWRRSWHVVPPEMEEEDPRRLEEFRKYGTITENAVPKAESLSMVAEERIRPFLTENLTPILDSAHEYRMSSSSSSLFATEEKEVALDGTHTHKKADGGGTALVVAHANSIRALIGVLCNVEDDPAGVALNKLERMKLPTATPLVIKFRKTEVEGRYYPVDGGLDEDVKNDLPVYPLSSLKLMK